METTSKETALKILTDVQFVAISTVTEGGRPWNSPVFYAYDEQYCIYWSSLESSVHSQNIIRNKNAFLVVFGTNDEAATGLYMNCSVEMVDSEEEIQKGLELLGERRGKPFDNIEKYLKKDKQRIFKAIPQEIWMNDAEKDEDGDFVRDFRVEVIL